MSETSLVNSSVTSTTAAAESSDMTSMSNAMRMGSKFEFLTAPAIAVVSSAMF